MNSKEEIVCWMINGETVECPNLLLVPEEVWKDKEAKLSALSTNKKFLGAVTRYPLTDDVR
jgi:hypothetical protein